jgi:predicted NBD/HSP70 family sugar kinase
MNQPPSGATSRDDIRTGNLRAVLNTIHRHGLISRSDVAAELHLSPSAVTSITGDLITAGLVYEAEEGVTQGAGRKPILLRLNYDHGKVVGIKVSASQIVSVIANLEAEVTAVRHDGIVGSDVGTVIDTISTGILEMLSEGGLALDDLVGACVSVPGVVDTVDGLVRHSPFGWQRTPFRDLLAEQLGLPVLIENDVNALAIAEAWYGLGRDHRDFLVVTLGRGVGLGIVLDGQVYRGAAGGAGEFGHALMPGDEGTVESHLSDAALLDLAAETIKHFRANGSSEQLVALAAAGDEDVLLLYERAGVALGKALSLLINTFAPSLLILGGEGVRAAPFMLPTARATLHELCYGDLAERARLVVDSWGDDAWARGAAGLAAAHHLSRVSARR